MDKQKTVEDVEVGIIENQETVGAILVFLLYLRMGVCDRISVKMQGSCQNGGLIRTGKGKKVGELSE
jgi:hypothetical protein